MRGTAEWGWGVAEWGSRMGVREPQKDGEKSISGGMQKLGLNVLRESVKSSFFLKSSFF